MLFEKIQKANLDYDKVELDLQNLELEQQALKNKINSYYIKISRNPGRRDTYMKDIEKAQATYKVNEKMKQQFTTKKQQLEETLKKLKDALVDSVKKKDGGK